MVSTPTTRNRLELIGTGDKTNTWGSSLNSNVFTMVDEAMDGVALITVSGNVTLTSTNYTSDQARMRQLWLSGAGGFTVTIPGVEKWYLVRNACSAAVTFSAGGVTASVPAAQSRMVFTNGTDVYVGDDGASLAYVDATFLKLTGGTMTGNITLVADGSSNLHPVTLQQLNAAVLAAAAGNLPALSGNALKFLRVNAGESSVEWATVDLTGFQPIDADLTAIAALTSAANKVPYSTGAGTWAMADFSAAGRALVDDADNAAQRTTLGLGTIATQYANNVAITGGSVTGITDLAVADGGTGASDAATARTNLGLGTMATQAASSVSISGGSITGITDLAIADGGTGASDAATARTNLGLAIGTNVQAYDPELAALASVTSAADALPYFTGSGTAGTTTLTSYGRTLIDDVDASTARSTLGLGSISTQAASSVSISGGSITGITDLAVADGGTGASDAAGARTNLGLGTMSTQAASSVSISGGSITGITDLAVADGGTGASDAATARTNLGLAIGTNVQAYDPELAALASVTSAADALPYFTGSGTAGTTTLTSYARTLIDDADASTARTTLGLGTMATQAASSVSISGGSITGITDLAVADGGTGASTAAGAATNLGLGTGDSPQFTAVNVGHATDTTVTRVSAGRIAVEGSNVLMASDTGTSGTKIPYLDGANTFSAAQRINAAVRVVADSAIEDGGANATNRGILSISGNPTNYSTASHGIEFKGSTFGSGYGFKITTIDSGGFFLDIASRSNSATWSDAFRLLTDGNLQLTSGRNTVYHAGNLPGTALTWTAAQTFSTSPIKIGDGVDSVAMTGTSPILRVQGASFTSGITVRRDGYAEVGIQASSVGNVGTWTNHALNIFVNAASVAQFPTGGGMTIGGNTVYHAGNLPGTALTWTAAQTFGASGNKLKSDQSAFLYSTAADTLRWIVGIRNDISGNTEDYIFYNSSLASTACTIDLTNDEFLFRVAPKVSTNTVYHAGNLPGTAITWTNNQTFSGSDANIATFFRSGAAAKTRWIETGGNNAWGIRNDANVLTLDYNNTDRLTLASDGVLSVNSNTVYHGGNLPGTAITWTAQQTFQTSGAEPIVVNRTTASDYSIVLKDNGTVRGYLGTSATNAFVVYNNDLTLNMSFNRTSGQLAAPTILARIAASSETSGTLTSASANKTIQLTGNITINNSVFAAGDVVVVYAGSSSRTITAGTITTMRLDGTSTTGSRTVAAYGMASIFFVSATECVVSGGSVT